MGSWCDEEPESSIAFPLDDAHLGLSFGAIIDNGEAFWRMGLVGERPECWDLDLNKSTSLR